MSYSQAKTMIQSLAIPDPASVVRYFGVKGRNRHLSLCHQGRKQSSVASARMSFSLEADFLVHAQVHAVYGPSARSRASQSMPALGMPNRDHHIDRHHGGIVREIHRH